MRYFLLLLQPSRRLSTHVLLGRWLVEQRALCARISASVLFSNPNDVPGRSHEAPVPPEGRSIFLFRRHTSSGRATTGLDSSHKRPIFLGSWQDEIIIFRVSLLRRSPIGCGIATGNVNSLCSAGYGGSAPELSKILAPTAAVPPLSPGFARSRSCPPSVGSLCQSRRENLHQKGV
ncbi:Hypothetical predicted protein [Podarcis lilfordi]|uniref:Uncharacterized protein n=1 Tax=Podarcis lilfordi TaxID=74358 RepID=A0AA35PDK3_9SAUR|nr:Hypothetical predicted protein [Podarcis lilfordi]